MGERLLFFVVQRIFTVASRAELFIFSKSGVGSGMVMVITWGTSTFFIVVDVGLFCVTFVKAGVVVAGSSVMIGFVLVPIGSI